MRALILAAGRGSRMGELTRHTPKPLLQVAGRPLIEYAIANVKRAGIKEIVINVFYHAEQIKAALGDGKRYGVHIEYSEEKETLEVGGGMLAALDLLEDTFIAVSSDVVTDFPLHQLLKEPQALAHLILVDNPPFHPEGDFGLKEGYVDLTASPTFNYAGIGVYKKTLFNTQKPGWAKWSDIIFPAIQKNKVTGAYYKGLWYNIGTPADLAAIQSLEFNLTD